MSLGANDAPAQRYRLLRRAAVRTIEPTEEQRAVIAHDRGRLRVLAGPGTGKTATVVEAVANRIVRRQTAPQSILVLTYSRRAAAELTERIASRVDITTTEPMVRTLHSYAYALLRAGAAATGVPAPSLLPAGQADLMVREILAGHADAGGAYWPAGFHAALRVPAFAAELRELMLRAAERRVTPKKMTALGRRLGREEWVAAARFIDEYRDIADLRQGTTRRGVKLDQAELIAAALETLADPAVLAAERARVKRIFVDEFQDVDPAQAALVEVIAAGADELVVVGDPDQSIYAFRGAAPGVLDRIDVDGTVSLSVCRRMPATVLDATRRVAAALPGTRRHRDLTTVPGRGDGLLDVRVFGSARQEAAYVADQLRRAHVERGVPFSEMAVLLRSRAAGAEVYRAALAQAGLPVADRAVRPLVAEPVVAALLGVLRAGIDPDEFDGESAMDLLASPLAGMDVLAIRRLRRAIRREAAAGRGPASGGAVAVGVAGNTRSAGAETLAQILLGLRPPPGGLATDLRAPLERLTTLIALAAEGREEPSAESVLWRVWQASGLAGRLTERSARGGSDGARADADLDAVIDLFERAAGLAQELPFPGIGGLIGLLADEQVAAARPVEPIEAVAILSAHASKGLEWDVVAVAGVQEELWPDLRPRTGLLHQEALLDAAEGIDDALPAASRLADERRLFYVATTRARRQLIVTATETAETTPSRLLAELTGGVEPDRGWPAGPGGRVRRALQLPALVAELRAVVCAPASGTASGFDGARRHRAARVLARLAEAGVRGADPREWYGLAAVTTEAPLVADGEPVPLSPSQIESAQECALRTALERHGGRGDLQQPQLLGIAVHALAQGIAIGATAADIDVAVEEFLAQQATLAPWEIGRLRRRITKMRRALQAWVAGPGADRTLIGSELAMDVTVAAAGDSDQAIRLRGRIDWLSLDADGRVVITDFKTGASVPSHADAQQHPQLATYQLALALGALATAFDGPTPDLGGAELVYLSSGAPVLRAQAALSAEAGEVWLGTLRSVAAEVTGPSFTARQGEYCERCPVRGSCPLQAEGRQVTA